jgi:DNA processing protein
MSLLPYLQLSLTAGIGPVLSRRLIESSGSADAATRLSRPDLQEIEGIGRAKADSIAAALRTALPEAEEQVAKSKEQGARILCQDDVDWPELLRPLEDAPLVLYVLGTLEPRDLHSLAIVGSRRCSHYGREQAERFAALLAGAGFTIVSGGARGTDSAAHRGALQHPHGRTIAVTGSGLDVVYPPENVSLFKQIAERGAVVSEFPFGTPPVAENFPRRNRVVSGLSRGVLVIEAAEKSGALITARLANEDHNRPVFALPGRVDNALSAGPHQLIRDGAVLAGSLEDILNGLGPLPDSAVRVEAGAEAASVPTQHSAPAPELTPAQRRLLDELSADPTAVDALIDRTELPAPSVLQELTFLTLKGLVKRIDGQTYVRRS